MNNWATGWSFLHLNGGFWFIGLPIIVLWVLSDLYVKDKDAHSLNELEDFIDIEDIEELELYKMEFKVSKEEKWKIGQVLKRAEYRNVDELVRNSLHEMIKQ